ncbi:hypothetical protein [Gallaecimonas xiamenensis]|uniref:Uncharacterized protein n=1 Tax=Gallaecimonas xiamenensis 3-C-1 TaxID=745411 RepID=K2JTF6_9GAMM|nr:hypothetical protein [Gallaecimonas xiamenensis]EKE77802.1 hypothetical protein B3C1_00040 [Gallaecimonas xiamenensis 3-C-1]
MKRSNIFYPTSGNSRDLVGLLFNLTLDDEKLEDIIELEEESHRKNEQGVDAEALELLIKKAKKELKINPEDVERIYIQILRGGSVPRKISAAEYPLLVSSFQRLIPELRENVSFTRAHFDTYKALVLFGESSHYSISNQSSQSFASYSVYLKAWSQINKYSHMRGMAAKLDKFRPFSEDVAVVNRFQEVLDCTNYQHMRVIRSEYYSVSTLYFWGMLLTLLLNKDVRFSVLDKFFSLSNSIPLFDEHIENLDFFVEAVGDAELSAYYSSKK